MADAGANQFQLLTQRRFGPLFATQFLGAFNDNLFKAAVSLLFVFSGLVAAEATDVLVNAAAALFILPYFLFSATAGQLADKFEKARLVRYIKLGEIVIAVLGGVAVITQSLWGMLTVLFMLGVQSTFFGPLKYSILPQHLDETELVGGNAQIEMGTFVAILLGTLAGGVVAIMNDVSVVLTVFVGAVAVVGYLASRAIPKTPATDPQLRINWNPVTETWRILQLARRNYSVFLSLLGISWFWLVGSILLAQIPTLAAKHLAGDQTVVTLILSVFTVSVALGSLACEKLSGRRIEIGLVPFGAMGLAVAGCELYFALGAAEAALPAGDVYPRGAWAFATGAGGVRILVDMAFLGFFGGTFIVPLYALIQARTEAPYRARIIAANNIINAFFMVAGSLLAIVLLTVAELTIPELLLTVFVMHIAVSVFIFQQVPEFTMRFLVWLLSHTMYRVTHRNLDVIPEEGAAIIVCNHISYVDALLLAGAVRRPIRFIMYKPIYDIPVLNFVFRTGRAIPINNQHADKDAYETAMRSISEGLDAGDLLCIFPEGKLTTDGELNEFKTGIERILADTPAPVVPMALRGLWGSFFSHHGGMFKGPKRFWSRVEVVAGALVEPAAATAARLQAEVLALRGDAR